jgi:hypothetical protein
MPYRRVYLWILLLFPAVGVAFWQSYWSQPGGVAWELHAHGLTSALWIALLAIQSWSIHRAPGRKGLALHRLTGRLSLYLFPLFWAAGIAIVHLMAAGFVVRDNPFHTMFGARLTAVDIITSGGILFLYWHGLRRRRSVLTHAAAMLAIVLFLLPPIVVRLLQGLPLFSIHSMAEMGRFGIALQVSNGIAILLGIILYARRPRTAWPFLLAATLIAMQGIAFETIGASEGWEGLMPGIWSMPVAGVMVVALIVASMVVWSGWSGAPDPRHSRLKDAPAEPAAAPIVGEG